MPVHSVGDLGDKITLMGHVRHSQSVTAPQLHPWIAAEKGGSIIIMCTAAEKGGPL